MGWPAGAWEPEFVPADHDEGAQPDVLADQIALFVNGGLGPQGRDELYAEVRRIARRVASQRLTGPGLAEEVEHETWRKLVERVRRPGYAADPIRHGAAYVRRTAESVCADLGRDLTKRRREVPAHEHETAGAEPARTEHVVHPVHKDNIDVFLTGDYGVVSERLREDLRETNEKWVRILFLRQQDLSYVQIAAHPEISMSPGQAQKCGERAAHELRGRATVVVWSLTPVESWETPRCDVLAGLRRQTAVVLAAGGKPSKDLLERIGKHINPNPNRVRGRDPACELCRPDFEITVRVYEMLVSLVPSVLAEKRRWRWRFPRRRRPSSPRGPARPPETASRVARGIGGLIGVGLVLTCCGFGVKQVSEINFEELFASPSAAPSTSRPTPARSRTTRPVPSPTVVALCGRISAAQVANRLGTLPMSRCEGSPSTAWAKFETASAGNGDFVSVTRQAAGEEGLGECSPIGDTGTIPGVGDENCYRVDSSATPVGGEARVREGNRVIVIIVGMLGITRDGLFRLTSYLTDRLL
jgi:DNA-directed RNA polymerase specialized sigma24 family protein